MLAAFYALIDPFGIYSLVSGKLCLIESNGNFRKSISII